ncbi:type I phosphodiesterase / nucleotide pyrophosphatase domain-containing protein [Ditylenchus destructor]|uniref:Type I phosphodiesterase / nucleotide pyrophosphatase domain-containing protein n=1 Tax=Ditylenchus destructor TaxID=166010 RepID=A0AAD4MNE4_9BILA|nr:type I phosphodiesterase / nucleotide pyrophosphatase domain-containing protein [Ditylenchus destructor]
MGFKFVKNLSGRAIAILSAAIFAGLVLVTVATIILVTSLSGRPVKADDGIKMPEERTAWHNGDCNVKCNNSDYPTPPLLLISLDGFANQYMGRNIMTSLDRMARCGTRAKHMFPSYPSKTFPNHMTMATGLYPETHGIVDNTIYDEELTGKMINAVFADSRAFHGEPIWSAAVRSGLRSNALGWFPSFKNITGYNPTVLVSYDAHMSNKQRMDIILDWLKQPADKRPHLLNAYFDEPDMTGHYYTNRRKPLEVSRTLKKLNRQFEYLFSELYQANILDCINIVIVSDHGMQTLDSRVYMDELIHNHHWGHASFKAKDAWNFVKDGMEISNSVVARVHIAKAENTTTESLMAEMECYDKDSFRAYDRKSMPKRYHYAASPRVGDVVLEGRPGKLIFKDLESDLESETFTGDHGYDYVEAVMHSIFFARGPEIQNGLVVEPFQNVELFNLFTDLLRLEPKFPNNGTLGSMDHIMKNLSLIRPFEEPLQPVQSSGAVTQLFALFENETKTLNCDSPASGTLGAPFYSKMSNTFTTERYCDSILLRSNDTSRKGVSTMILEPLSYSDQTNEGRRPINDFWPTFASSCDQECRTNWFNAVHYINTDSTDNVSGSIVASKSFDVLSRLSSLQFLINTDFSRAQLSWLNNLTDKYAYKYEQVLSISGTIFDYDLNGVADDPLSVDMETPWGLLDSPSHIFRILIRCEDGPHNGAWGYESGRCATPSQTRILAFILPVQKEANCLDPDVYLFANTARVRDIELLTGVQFFADNSTFAGVEKPLIYNWRLNITTELWDY